MIVMCVMIMTMTMMMMTMMTNMILVQYLQRTGVCYDCYLCYDHDQGVYYDQDHDDDKNDNGGYLQSTGGLLARSSPPLSSVLT